MPIANARHASASFGALALALLFAQPAHAAADPAADAPAADAPAPDAPDPGIPAGDIVVTAQHRQERLQDVPSAITSLDKEAFTLGGVGRSASDVLLQVPNASAGNTQHGRPRWWIRGVGAGQQQLDLANPVGFYLDDVYISNASATGIPLFDVQRVEVLRGPQGTLWGKNTTGGAINVISAKPRTSGDQDSYVKLEYGSYDDKIAEGGIGLALVPDKLAARVSFRLDDRGGRFRNLYTGAKADKIQDDNVRAQLLWKPVDAVDALLSFHYRRYETQGDLWTTASYAQSGIYRSGYVPSTGYSDISENSPVFSNQAQIGGNLHLDWHLGNGITASSITGYERYDTTAAADSDYTPLAISAGYTKAYSSQWSQELRLTSAQHQRLTWIAGAFFFAEKIHSDAYTAALPAGVAPVEQIGIAPTSIFSQIDYGHKAISGAVYGSATYAFSDALKLTGGLRWSRETKTLDTWRNASLPSGVGVSYSNLARWWNGYTGTFGGGGTIPLTHFKPTWDALTYDVTPSWNVTRNALAYFKFAHGVKSGGFNTAATAVAALQVVAPEKLDAFEFGFKSTWLGGRLTLNADAFHYNYRNVQVNVVGPNPFAPGAISYLQNAAKAHTDGGEIDLNATPTDNLRLNASAGFLYTRFDAFQVVNGGANLTGNQFVRAPHFTLNAGAAYDVPLGKAGKLEFEADARYQSHQYYYVNVQAAQDPGRTNLGQNGYTLANARVTWTAPGDHLSASFFVNNLLDKHTINHALPGFTASSVANVNAAPASAILGDIVQYGDPRTWGVSAIYRF